MKYWKEIALKSTKGEINSPILEKNQFFKDFHFVINGKKIFHIVFKNLKKYIKENIVLTNR